LIQITSSSANPRLSRFEAAGQGADIFVAHLLQTFGRERGTAATAAVADDRHVTIGKFVFDFQLEHATAHVNRVGNVFLVPFVLLANVDNHRVAAFRFDAASVGEISVIFFFASATNS